MARVARHRLGHGHRTRAGDLSAAGVDHLLLGGAAVGRLRLTGTRVATLLLAFGGLLAVAAVVVSDRLVYRQTVLRQLAADVGTTDLDYVRHLLDWGLAGFVPGGSNWWLAVSAPHSGTPFDLATTIGTALALVGACLLLARLLPRAITVLSGPAP